MTQIKNKPNRHSFLRCFIIGIIGNLFISQFSNAAMDASIGVTSFTLDNGLHVIHNHRPYSNSVTLQMVVNDGFSMYACNNQQIPHILEHMLLSETQRFAEGEMRKTVKNLGGLLLGFTSPEYTHYTISLHSDYFTTGVELLHSIIFEPSFSSRNLNKSASAIHAELGTTENMFKNLIHSKPAVKDLGIARLYTNSNLDCTERSSPSGITLADVQKSYDTFYYPPNMTLIVVGNIEAEQLTHTTLNALAKEPSKRHSNSVGTPTAFSHSIRPLTLDSTPIVEHSYFADSKVHVNLLLPATGKSSGETTAFQLISDYFGESLFNELRAKQGIAYSPRANYIAGSSLGHIYVTAETTPQWEASVTKTFLSRYQSIIQNGIPAKDIARLKNRAILHFESKERKNIDVAQQIRHHRLHVKKTGAMPNTIEDIRALSPQSIKQVIDNYFPQQPILATLRPLNNNELAKRFLLIVIISALVALPLLRWLRSRRQVIASKSP